MTAERSLLEHQREASAAKHAFADELDHTSELCERRLLREGWSEECLDAERRFGSRAARLYPLIGIENAVVTPMGPGRLLQVFADVPGRPGAMVMHLRPRAFITEYGKDGKSKSRAAAVFVAVDDVKPYGKGGA